jgi:hypothetical protein
MSRLLRQIPFGSNSVVLTLNPAIWETIAATGFDRIDVADMGHSGAVPLHILWRCDIL